MSVNTKLVFTPNKVHTKSKMGSKVKVNTSLKPKFLKDVPTYLLSGFSGDLKTHSHNS